MNWICEFCGAKEPIVFKEGQRIPDMPEGWVDYEIADEYCPYCGNVEIEGRSLDFCCEEHKQGWLTEND